MIISHVFKTLLKAAGLAILLIPLNAHAQINQSPVDIKGVKLGMSLEQASEILEQKGYVIEKAPERIYSSSFTYQGEKFEEELGRSLMTVIAQKNDNGNDIIHLATSGALGKNDVVIVTRALKFPDKGKKPIWGKFKEQISEKFGEPHTKDEFKNYSLRKEPWLEYEWNSKGKKRNRTAVKALNAAVSVSSSAPAEKPVPDCAKPEQGVFQSFGSNFNYGYSASLEGDYSNHYIHSFRQVDTIWGRGFEEYPALVKAASKKVLYADGCRTVFFIRGQVDKSTQESQKILFMMMDHRTLKKQLKEFEKTRDEFNYKMREKLRNKKVETVENAPEVDL